MNCMRSWMASGCSNKQKLKIATHGVRAITNQLSHQILLMVHILLNRTLKDNLSERLLKHLGSLISRHKIQFQLSFLL